MDRTNALIASGRLPVLARLAEQGTGVARTIPVDAPATATARATFETGAGPNAHGIVANSFHIRGEPITATRSGFGVAYATETLYDAAARQARSVATVGIGRRPGLGVDAWVARATAGRVIRPARIVTLTLAKPADTVRVATEGDSVRLILRLDGRRVYALAPSAGAAPVPLNGSEWTPVWLTRASPRAGVWMKAVDAPPDGNSARIYVGPVVVTDAAPALLISELEARLGPAPATPDYSHHAAGTIDDATWRDQVLREAEYLTVAAERIRANLAPDLVIVALNLLDAHEHQFLRAHPRHPRFARSPAADQSRWRSWIDDAYIAADGMIGRLTRGARNVIVSSEYALLPIHSRVQLSAALRRLGYAVSGDTAELRVLASSASAHIRLNVRGREPTGRVIDSTAVVGRLADQLRDLRDPVTNEPVVARVETVAAMRDRGDQMAALGEVRVIARPGYAFGDDVNAQNVIDEPFLPGEHAFDPALSETHGVFIAAGRDVERRRLARVDAADVAVTGAALLGIAPPRGSTGRLPIRRPN